MKSNSARFILSLSLGFTGVFMIGDALTAIGTLLMVWAVYIPTGDLPDEK